MFLSFRTTSTVRATNCRRFAQHYLFLAAHSPRQRARPRFSLFVSDQLSCGDIMPKWKQALSSGGVSRKRVRNTYNLSSCKRALGDASVQLLIDDKQQRVASHEIWVTTFRRCLLWPALNWERGAILLQSREQILYTGSSYQNPRRTPQACRNVLISLQRFFSPSANHFKSSYQLVFFKWLKTFDSIILKS